MPLTEYDVRVLYHRFVVKPTTYHMRTLTDIDTSGVLAHYDARGKDAPRVFTLMDFKEWVKKYSIHPKNALLTDPNDYELPFVSMERSTVINYASDPKAYDLHTLALPHKDYDFVLFSQTLEHLYNPYRCVRNLYDHMASGGYVFTSVPTVNIPHMVPIHFSHFYPIGLICMFVECGFEVLEVGYWGTLEYIQTIFRTYGWPDIYSLSSVVNDPEHPAQCWILARKA